MINKACFVLLVALCPATLFAGETMVTQTTRTTTGCNFRVDKCETSVATDPSYFHFKDGKAPLAPSDTSPSTGVPAPDQSPFIFVDYDSAPQQQTVEELVALIRHNLSNCPEVTIYYNGITGDITVHYLNSTCDCDCDWDVNVRNVKADDFVWKRTSDNYSPYLGQMERRKFHCRSERDAQSIESACEQICKINNWETYK
jgi:hypothetical protein